MEALRMESNYSSNVSRTGVMAIMKVYVADPVVEELEPLTVRDIEQVVNSVEWKVDVLHVHSFVCLSIQRTKYGL